MLQKVSQKDKIKNLPFKNPYRILDFKDKKYGVKFLLHYID